MENDHNLFQSLTGLLAKHKDDRESGLFKSIALLLTNYLSENNQIDFNTYVTARRNLQESEQRFKKLFYENPSPMLLINPENGKIEEANQSASRFYGYAIQKLLTLSISDLNILPAPEIKKELQLSGNKGNNYFQYKHKLADGSIRDVEVFSVRLKLNGHDSIHAIIHDITERKMAVEQMALLNDRMEFAMTANDMAWWEMELPEGNVVFNDNKVRMLGYDKEKFKTYLDFMKLVHPDDYEPTMEAMRQYLAGKKDRYFCEYRIKSKNKNYIWYRDVGKISYKTEGYIKVTGISKDITKYKSAEQRLVASERRLKLILENTPVGIAVVKDRIMMYVNPEFQRMVGYDSIDLVDKSAEILYPGKEEFKRVGKEKYPKIKKSGSTSMETTFKRKDGKLINILMRTSAIDPTDFSAGFISSVIDITAQKNAAQAIKESEEKYRALYNNAPLAYQSLNEEGCILDVNPQWEKTLGYKRAEIIGKWFGDFLHEDYVVHFKKNFPEFKKRGIIHDVQFRMKKKDGRYIHVSFEGCIGYTPDGKFKQTFCTFKDITIENAMRKKLKESEERFRKLIENIDEGVILVNPKGTIVQKNDAANQILGTSNGDLNGVDVDKFTYTTIHEDGSVFKPEDHPSMITIRDKIPQHNVVMGIVRKTGDKTWLKINSEPLYLSDHEGPHALVSFTDITTLVEKEKKLKESNATKDRFFFHSRTRSEKPIQRIAWFYRVADAKLRSLRC